MQRFERQVRVWRKLDNPFILRLYGWCKFDGETYLVSPWLKNRDVVKYLEGDGDRRLRCLSLISQGLRYLHVQGIIHGALKPSNILVQDDGHAVLSDFSLAKLAAPEAKNTEDNLQINFYRYQAPEVILEQAISEASDVYSWAMTALEIITGNPPYHTWKSPGQFIPQIVTKNQIPTRSDYDSSVLGRYPEIWELFVRCWNREPVNRPTAEKMVEELEKILGLK
ncbi:hypothetical protein M407DRAFT_84561 [Tulasnella calospora MUT 4182]|uniref:Protein kinase domain-containing protein n=1 Tax=Tulasnella calospora MUT 4182 TaxID=1051891 RepID=A0A0C3Q4P6_9AGAM|nr:hypothetical protein M407DRAFT_84561 [Tulasnella calospora MUT 4182]